MVVRLCIGSFSDRTEYSLEGALLAVFAVAAHASFEAIAMPRVNCLFRPGWHDAPHPDWPGTLAAESSIEAVDRAAAALAASRLLNRRPCVHRRLIRPRSEWAMSL